MGGAGLPYIPTDVFTHEHGEGFIYGPIAITSHCDTWVEASLRIVK